MHVCMIMCVHAVHVHVRMRVGVSMQHARSHRHVRVQCAHAARRMLHAHWAVLQVAPEIERSQQLAE